MDHELKQRLIGAVVVTALCAIFIPMLFDDPVDNSGQLVTELSIPAPNFDSSEKLPAGAGQVSKLPDSDPLSTEAAGDVIESTGAAEEAAEPDVNSSKQGRPGESLYAESDGYAPDDAAEVETPLTKGEVEDLRISNNQPKSHSKPDDLAQSRSASANSVKNMVSKLPVKDSHMEIVTKEPVKPKRITDTLKPVVVKKIDKSAPGAGIAPHESELSMTVKDENSKVEAKQPSNAKDLAAVVADAKKPGGATKTTPKLMRWYVQVGSFSKKENAMSLWDSLHEQGLPASLDTVQTDKGTTYRLRVGPELDGKKAAAMKARLDKQNIKAILISE